MTKLEASEASHKIAPVNSSGVPNLFIGVCLSIAFFRSSSIKFFKFHSVGKNPGLIAFTLTPFVPHSLPKFWVKFFIADLAAE